MANKKTVRLKPAWNPSILSWTPESEEAIALVDKTGYPPYPDLLHYERCITERNSLNWGRPMAREKRRRSKGIQHAAGCHCFKQCDSRRATDFQSVRFSLHQVHPQLAEPSHPCATASSSAIPDELRTSSPCGHPNPPTAPNREPIRHRFPTSTCISHPRRMLTTRRGFEPRLTVPKTVVLPLHYRVAIMRFCFMSVLNGPRPCPTRERIENRP